MNRRLTLAVLSLAFSGTAAALPMFGKHSPHDGDRTAQPGESFAPPGRATAEQARDGISPQAAAHQAQSLNGGGRVLSVDATEGGWRVKLLKDGTVRIVFVPN